MFENWKRKDEYSMSLLVVDQFRIRLFGVFMRLCTCKREVNLRCPEEVVYLV